MASLSVDQSLDPSPTKTEMHKLIHTTIRFVTQSFLLLLLCILVTLPQAPNQTSNRMCNSADTFGYILGALAILQFLYSVRFHLPGRRAAALKVALASVNASFFKAVEAGLSDSVNYYCRLTGIEARAKQLLRRSSNDETITLSLWQEYVQFFAGRSWTIYMCTLDAYKLEKDIAHELCTRRT